MNWLMSLLGIGDPLSKKKRELSNIQTQAMIAQRNGDLRTYAKLTEKAQGIEDEIIKIQKS